MAAISNLGSATIRELADASCEATNKNFDVGNRPGDVHLTLGG